MNDWFSASIEMSCVDESGFVVIQSRSVWIFQSRDFDGAFRRALEIGYSHERSYENANGLMVHWKLSHISSLELFAMSETSPVEVHHEFSEESVGMEVGLHFKPEAFRPDL